MMSTIVLTLSKSVSVTMCATGSSWKVPAMLLVGPEISEPLIVLWAKSTTLAHIGSHDVATSKLSNRIESLSKFIVSDNKRKQGIGFHVTGFFGRSGIGTSLSHFCFRETVW